MIVVEWICLVVCMELEMVICEGIKSEEILELIEVDVDIVILVFVVSINLEGFGFLVFLIVGWFVGMFLILVIIVFGNLDDDLIVVLV